MGAVGQGKKEDDTLFIQQPHFWSVVGVVMFLGEVRASNKKVALAFFFFARYLFETNRLTTALSTASQLETLGKEGKTATLHCLSS